jgi:hypothetical protein
MASGVHTEDKSAQTCEYSFLVISIMNPQNEAWAHSTFLGIFVKVYISEILSGIL